MYRKIYAFFIVLIFPILIYAQKNNTSGFTITGNTSGFNDGASVNVFFVGDNTPRFSTIIKKNKFIIKGSLDEPRLCFLVFETEASPLQIFLENNPVTIQIIKGKIDKAVIAGSLSHQYFTEFMAGFIPYISQMNALASTINSLPEGTERVSMMKTYSDLQGKMNSNIENFIKLHPASYVSVFVIDAVSQLNDDAILMETRFNLLNKKIKNSIAGNIISQKIKQGKIGAIGSMAMNFTQPDTLGNPIALTSFKGKYVLLDFWASWCGPCRRENPTVVYNYNKFKNKNFTVLSVSLDRQDAKQNWLDAIHKDGLYWTNVSDLQFWNNAAALLYNIHSIPQNVLIDPSGKIIAKNLHGNDLESRLCEILGCN